MMSPLPATLRSELSALIARTIGLHYPPERWADLERGLRSATPEFGFGEVEACARWLLSSVLNRRQVEVLAKNLTVGETYFFREPRTFEILETRVIPELARARREDKSLRVWSAACCTGEEPYSIAISLKKIVPDLADWRITILGSDINPCFLDKAAKGVYGEWSFRSAPSWLKERNFHKTDEERWKIAPEFKRLVNFSHINLAEDVYPSPHNDTNGMDLIFCRNALIYFSPEGGARVVEKLHRCLREGGWLVLGASETPHLCFPDLEPVIFEGTVLFQKNRNRKLPAELSFSRSENGGQRIIPDHESDGGANRTCDRSPNLGGAEDTTAGFEDSAGRASPSRRAADLSSENGMPGSGRFTQPSKGDDVPGAEPRPSAYELALRLYEQGRYAETVAALEARLSSTSGEVGEWILLSRSLANQGRLSEALRWSDRAVATEKLNPSAHYLHASILQELGNAGEAALACKRTLYLDPGFVLAHFALGAAAVNTGSIEESRRHYRNALALLRQRTRDEVLDETDGLTAGRLAEMISASLEANSELPRTAPEA